MWGYRTMEEVMAEENNRLALLEQQMLFQPEQTQPSDSFHIDPKNQMDPSVARNKTNKVELTNLLRSNLKTVMSNDGEVAAFLAMVSLDDIIKLNSQWSTIAARVGKSKSLTAAQMMGYMDQLFNTPNFGFFKDEV
jgi:hypothetical protein